jgi:hypothetical protein
MLGPKIRFISFIYESKTDTGLHLLLADVEVYEP